MFRYENNSSGFILLIVLLFLQLFTFLGVYELQIIRANTQMTAHLLQRQQTELILKEILNTLKRKLLNESPFCVFDDTLPEGAAEHTEEWWNQHACSGILNGFRYYYLVQFLGNGFNERTEINYYRLSLFYPDKHIFLQSTIIKPVAIDSKQVFKRSE